MTPKPTQPPRLPIDWPIALTLFWLSAALTYIYAAHYLIEYRNGQLSLVIEIVKGTALSPYLYRILIPILLGGSARVLETIFNLDLVSGVWLTQHTINIICLFIFFYGFYVLLSSTFTREQSLIGALLAAVPLPLTFSDHNFQPWSIPEAALLMIALLCIYFRKPAILALTILLASLNRETVLMLPIAFLIATLDAPAILRRQQPIPWKTLLQTLAYLLIWLIVFAGLRLLRGSADSVTPLAKVFDENIRTWPIALTHAVLLFGAALILAIPGYRRAPAFWRRLAFLIPIYLLPILLFGVWRESRLLMPIMPILIALALSYLFPPTNT